MTTQSDTPAYRRLGIAGGLLVRDFMVGLGYTSAPGGGVCLPPPGWSDARVATELADKIPNLTVSQVANVRLKLFGILRQAAVPAPEPQELESRIDALQAKAATLQESLQAALARLDVLEAAQAYRNGATKIAVPYVAPSTGPGR
jgi:hypothetical protein